MKGESARIRNAMRRIDAAEKWLVDNALKPDYMPRTVWQTGLRQKRRDREDGIEALIAACRDYLKRS